MWLLLLICPIVGDKCRRLRQRREDRTKAQIILETSNRANVALWLCGSAAVRLCGFVALWSCCFVASWLCGVSALWLYGSAPLRLCGLVAL